MSPSPVFTRSGASGSMARHLTGLGLLAGALLLGGCAGVIRLENDVRSYADWTASATGALMRPAPGDFYRIERRPSQRQDPAAQQEAIEAIARDALQRVGLRAAPEPLPAGLPAPRWTVELGARSIRLPQAPWDEPGRAAFGMSLGIGHVGHHGSIGIGMPLFPHVVPPYYQREVSIVLRDARSARVVYETQAAHDGPWADSPTLWAALYDAALQGFPQPPAGPRRVVIEVPR
ncbi:hypothetical protein [Malikia sp.]|uniref:hypothetical protein n=1 Tax=Malikia sp. TaxID=2070706 RepID=UPI00260472DF|nr:hypothetical protein [Malikia sp.]MDD2729258.1 hypothetical protein [Malikia sp.]